MVRNWAFLRGLLAATLSLPVAGSADHSGFSEAPAPVPVVGYDGGWRVALLDVPRRTWSIVPAKGDAKPRDQSWTLSLPGWVVVWGGREEGAESPVGLALHLASGTWRRMPELPIPMRDSFPSIALTRHEIVLWGGLDYQASRECVNTGAIFDLRRWTWRVMAPSPLVGRYSHSMSMIGRKLIVFGGVGQGGKVFRDGALYDLSSGTWKVLPEAPIEPRWNHGAVPCGQSLLVWGGFTGQSAPGPASNTGAMLDISSGNWSLIPEAPIPQRAHSAALCLGTRLWVWGGMPPTGPYDAQGALFDPYESKWTRIALSPFAWSPWIRATSINGRALLWPSIKTGKSTIHLYDPDLNQWSQMPEAPFPSATWFTERTL